jgi:uncharacterized protein (TIGR02099 family)
MDNTSSPNDLKASPPVPRSGDALNRALVNVGVLVVFAVLLSVLLLREVIMPRVQDYAPHIEAALARTIGAQVRIEQLSADWHGFRPRLHVRGLSVVGPDGETAFGFGEVDATLAWSSFALWEPHFRRLVIHAPQLALHRGVDGRVRVGEIDLEHTTETRAASALLAWALAQREVLILGARVQWLDWLRAAAPLVVDRVDFRLTSRLGRHRFGIRVSSVGDLWQRVELRGDLEGADAFDSGTWNGQLFLAVEELDFTAAQFLMDLPEMPGGYGNLRAWLDVRSGAVRAATLDVALVDLAVRLAPDLPRLAVTDVQGRVSVSTLDRFALSLRGLSFAAVDGERFGPLDFELTTDGPLATLAHGARVSFDRLDLAQATALAGYAPLPPNMRQLIEQADVSGIVSDFRADWRQAGLLPGHWQWRAAFDDFSSQPVGKLPGVTGMSGLVDGERDRGRFRIAGNDATMSLPAVFPSPVIALDQVSGEGNWAYRDGGYDISVTELRFENQDAAGTLSGSYRPGVGRRGEVDLVARLDRGEAEAVQRYLPLVMNPTARDWLGSALGGGSILDARLQLRGELDSFPFDDGAEGLFLVTARVAGVGLDYARDWPAIEDIDGQLRFEGRGMRIEAERARVLGVALGSVVAEIPRFGAEGGELLSVSGEARGATADFLRFISQSPVRGVAGGFADGISVAGSGVLALQLGLPIRDLSAARVNGEYGFSANRLRLIEGLPEVTDARGRVRFSERSFEIPEANGRMLGEALSVRTSTGEGGAARFRAEGGATVRGLREHHDWPWLVHLSGGAAWSADIDVVEAGVDVRIETALDGVSSSLPQPLNKRAGDSWPSTFEMRFRDRGATRTIALDLGGRASLALALSGQGDAMRLRRGGLAWGRALDEIGAGIKITAAFDALDADAWRRAMFAGDDADRGWLAALLAQGAVDVSLGRLTLFGQEFRNAELGALFDARGWRGRVASDRIAGSFDWRTDGGGVLEARLTRLALGEAGERTAETPPRDETGEPLRRLPALDVVADDFVLRGRSLGRLVLEASNENPFWRLDRFEIANDTDRLRGSGRWLTGSDLLTELDFRLDSGDVGALLGRVGYPDVVSRGRAILQGRASWQGTPLRLHYPSLSGAFDIDVTDGQFRQLEPGVGRLLGVLSLQSLPRRLALDFRDVFSEGFAFESVSGSIAMNRGVMVTEDLRIDGPAAKIWVTGEANLDRETQDLNVIVQPTLSESVAVGAAAGLINPVAGVLALLAQRIMADPIERMFAYSYAITGTWADPRVEKLTGAARGTEGTQEPVQ